LVNLLYRLILLSIPAQVQIGPEGRKRHGQLLVFRIRLV